MFNRKIIMVIITAVGLIVPILFLAKIIEASIAFPIIFMVLGCQQLYNGLFIVPRTNKVMRTFSNVLGTLFILFTIFIVMPHYYL